MCTLHWPNRRREWNIRSNLFIHPFLHLQCFTFSVQLACSKMKLENPFSLSSSLECMYIATRNWDTSRLSHSHPYTLLSRWYNSFSKKIISSAVWLPPFLSFSLLALHILIFMLSATSMFKYFMHVPLAHASQDLNADLQHICVFHSYWFMLLFFVLSTNFLNFREHPLFFL